MTRRLFVCHATADIEATSELVDALENALSFSTGSLWTSGLPGYSADANDMPALGAALAGSDVVLALVTQTSVQDAQFHFQLGAAWALGAHTVLFLLEPVADDALPSALDQATIMRGHEPSQWSELIGDLSVRLGLVPRPGASYAPAISPSSPPPAPKSAPPPPAALPSPPRIPVEAAALIASAEPATGPRLQARAASAGAVLTDAVAPAYITAATPGTSTANPATLDHAPASSAAPAHVALTDAAAPADDSPATPSASSALPDAAAPAHDKSAALGASFAQAALTDAAAPAHDKSAALGASSAQAALTDAAAPAHDKSAALGASSAQAALTDAAAPAYSAATTPTAARVDAAAAPADLAAANALTDQAAPAYSAVTTSTATRAETASDAPAHASTAAATPATQSAATARTVAASTPSASPAHASTAIDDSPTTPVKRADDTPLPAALAKIANASARPPGATTALHAASAQINAAKAQPQQPTAAAPAKTTSVPPLPGAPPARATNVPPLPTAGQARKVGVPPLPAAVSTSSLIVPPPPAGAHPDFDDSAEPTTTPKAPIIVLTSIPESEPESIKADLKPQPRAAGAYPSVAPQQSYLDELRAIDPSERTPPRYSYVDELETLDPDTEAAATSGYEALPSDDDDEPDTREQLKAPTRDGAPAADADEADPASDSDVFARLPTCEMALEAGRAVSDCLFNRDEISDFTAELDAPLGGLIECLGASWTELRDEQDLDTWVAVTDHLLQTLPEEVRKLEEWYRVGFELAILHNLAAQLVLDGSDPAAEQHWRGALERFLMRAERAEIGYENLGRVLGLLENLAGPSHERDLTNISRSLEELRRYAAGADIHTAA